MTCLYIQTSKLVKLMRMSDKLEVLILLSGGIDSTACTHLHVQQGMNVSALFIDYSQPSAHLESQAARSVCNFYGIDLAEVKLSGFTPPRGGYILARNIFLLSAALMLSKPASGTIVIGIHSGTAYVDCTEHFLALTKNIFDLYTDGTIALVAPFITYTKKDIYEYCKQFNVPLDLTYSCELGLPQPCGKCATCKDLEVLHVG